VHVVRGLAVIFGDAETAGEVLEAELLSAYATGLANAVPSSISSVPNGSSVGTLANTRPPIVRLPATSGIIISRPTDSSGGISFNRSSSVTSSMTYGRSSASRSRHSRLPCRAEHQPTQLVRADPVEPAHEVNPAGHLGQHRNQIRVHRPPRPVGDQFQFQPGIVTTAIRTAVGMPPCGCATGSLRVHPAMRCTSHALPAPRSPLGERLPAGHLSTA